MLLGTNDDGDPEPSRGAARRVDRRWGALKMDKLKVPLYVNALYFLILGVSALSASVVLTIFDYEVKDAGVLLVTAGAFLGFGAVVLGIASDPTKHGKSGRPDHDLADDLRRLSDVGLDPAHVHGAKRRRADRHRPRSYRLDVVIPGTAPARSMRPQRRPWPARTPIPCTAGNRTTGPDPLGTGGP